MSALQCKSAFQGCPERGVPLYMACMYYRQTSSNNCNNIANLFFNRVILEDMIQRTQLTTRAIRAPMWAMLSHHRLVLQGAL